MTTAQTVVGTD